MKKTFLVQEEDGSLLFEANACVHGNITSIQVRAYGPHWSTDYQGTVMASLIYDNWNGTLKLDSHENDIQATKAAIRVFERYTNPSWCGKIRLWKLAKEAK